MTKKLGTLEPVDVRDAWPNEASDFTPWLASEEGLKLLGEALDMDLEVEATEESVGPFSADILAKRTDTPDEHWVVIENQLAKTDHRHLGQLLTYAAGLKAATVIWIATEFTEEHRAAIDWLNEMTSDRLQFFGLKIELWRIGTSDPAPMFNVVSAPNEATNAAGMARETLEAGLSPLGAQKRRYWEAFATVLAAKNGKVKPARPRPQHWVSFGLGRSHLWLSTMLNSKDKTIAVEFAFNGPMKQAWFDQLAAKKAEIEATAGETLSWEAMETKKMSRIALYQSNRDPTVETDWPSQHAWLAEKVELFHKVFKPYVQALPGPADTTSEDAQPEPPEAGS
ncbi:DUF4268 domain-containing protein [Roseomonas sp. PWR1]|uniref:DUF4268 domain-containing protein n=1 Tax=Roseomonas nitratireducens TaxID=2820810 RepID=A0ABS4AWY7_9PROT|nr:DUF4268 domain-containing protein [Neoroseomonas nitratireducens]MBP0465878.1 DUF4268 domain-containing protein [Neoroseomonas nitratireducens]